MVEKVAGCSHHLAASERIGGGGIIWQGQQRFFVHEREGKKNDNFVPKYKGVCFINI